MSGVVQNANKHHTKHLVVAYKRLKTMEKLNRTVRPKIGDSRLWHLREVLIKGTDLTACRILVFWIMRWLIMRSDLPYTFQFLVIVNFSNIVITIVDIFQCNKQTFQSQDIQPFL